MNSIIRGTRNAGVIAGALTFLLLAGPQAVFAEIYPDVQEAVDNFDTAQQAAEDNVPANRTSKGLEDKLDEAARKQDDVNSNPKASDRQKERAQKAVDKAEETANAFNKGAMNKDAAKAYRASLEERREARKKLKELERKHLKATKAPKTSGQQLKVIRGSLKKADAAPPSGEMSRSIATASGELSRETGGGYENIGIPGFGVALDAGVVVQRLPKDNANIGVLRAGSGDRPFLGVKTVVYLGSTSAEGTLREIPLGDGRLQIGLGGGYGRAEDDRGSTIAPEFGIRHGLSYWDYSPDDSPGFSSLGGGVWGSVDTTFQRYQLNLDGKYGFRCPCGDEMDDDLDWRAPGFEIGTTYLKLGFNFDHSSQDTDQEFELMDPELRFRSFSVRSSTSVEVDDWRMGAELGVYHTFPLPREKNFAISFGVSTTLGYYDASADASQHNRCDVRLEQDPGVNACPLGQQNFKLDFDLDESGFEYGVNGMVRFDYRADRFLGGLRLGLVYDVDYSGISQFDAPSNLDREGPANLDWEHVVSHRVAAQLSYHF